MRTKILISVFIGTVLLLSFGIGVKDAKADALLFPWVVKNVDVSTIISVVNTGGNDIEDDFANPELHYQYFYKQTTVNEETEEYVEQFSLREGVNWLRRAVPKYFPAADFEIDLLPAEEGEENMLALRVYSSLSASEFREKRHLVCKAMLDADYKNLYNVISIFQRRTRNYGRQALSWYSPFSM